MLAVKSNEPLWVDTEHGPAQVAARQLAQQIPEEDWQRLRAGEGSKGPRLYDWGQASIRPGSEPDKPLAAGAPQHRRPPMTWLTTPAAVRRTRPWPNWCGWPATAGSSKMPSKKPNRRWDGTTTKCGAGPDGTAISPWRCWFTPSCRRAGCTPMPIMPKGGGIDYRAKPVDRSLGCSIICFRRLSSFC